MEDIMASYTISCSMDEIEKMKKTYQPHLVTPPNGAVFSAKLPGAVITAYHSGKVLFQGKNPSAEWKKWEGQPLNSQNSSKKPERAPHHYLPSDSLFTADHIGSDESGTGDYFGPITVASAYVTKEQIPLLKEIGIADSKKLTDEKIKLLSQQLMQIQIPYALLVLHNEKYNKLQAQGWSQGKMKTMLHHHAIQILLKKIAGSSYDGILIDQFCEPHVYQKHLRSEHTTLPAKTFFRTKAEDYSLAVAAASILARVSFINEMDKLSEKLGFPLLKGASKQVDQLAAKIIKNKGITTLQQCAKVHFANTEKAKNYLT